jgi:acyl carrier protein
MKSEVRELIAKVLNVPLDVVVDDLAVGDIPEWDSLAHMNIISAIEKEYGITLDIEQTLDIEDVEDIIEAVQLNR